MFTVKNSVVIDRPARDVFALVADPRNDPSWYTDVVEVTPTAGTERVGVGATFRWVLEFFGRKEVDMTITAHEPDQCVDIEALWGSKEAVFSYLLEPTPAGTRLTRTVQVACGMPGFTVPVARTVVQRRDAAFLRNLKALLEGTEPTRVPAAETMVPDEAQYPAEAM